MKKKIFKTFIIIIMVCLLVSLSQIVFAAPQQLQVVGTHTQTMSGCNFRLVGVNVCGLEWQENGMGPPSGAGGDIRQSITAAVNTWKSNIVRIPLDQDFWFGYDDGNSTSSGTQNTTYQNNYRTMVDNLIATASALNCYVELDLHWSGNGNWGTSTTSAQQTMPDAHSTNFWQDVATRYANNPAVIFDLYNEPYTSSWSIWKNGGTTSEGFTTPGFQALVKTVRDTGAKNIISIGGLGYSWDMTQASANKMTDTNTAGTLSGYGIMYEAHIYDNKGGSTESAKIALWNSNVTVAVAAGLCIMIGEFGPATNGTQDDSGCTPFESDLISWINGNNTSSYVYNAMAWCWHQGATPKLISDWNFTPTGCHGAQVKAWLAAITPPNCPAGTASFTPTMTSTPTYTRTATFTQTRTLTSTYTPTVVNTNTFTATRTYTPTYTFTLINTQTFTVTRTYTPTYTFTLNNTQTFTATVTSTPTYTFTLINTQTFTATRTNTPTYTFTLNNTPTFTATGTNTATSTMTRSVTPTFTIAPPTFTFTITDTPTSGNTPTFSSTPSNTTTFTYTLTVTNTVTQTATPTSTLWISPTFTSVVPETDTFTPVSTDTFTPVNSATNTFTATPTFTNNATKTFTAVNSATFTWTQTLTFTKTATGTNTYTATATPTWTQTLFSTSTITPTSTLNATATIVWENKFEITDELIYPNPYNPEFSDLKFNVTITQAASDLKARIYTVAFRKIIEADCGPLNVKTGVLTLPKRDMSKLAKGTYYLVISGSSNSGTKAISKPRCFLVL